ncbi:MAG: hypothetical protein V4617_21285 [Gemmatimonadota bacterium]
MSRISLVLQGLSVLNGVGLIVLTYWSRRRADQQFYAGAGLEWAPEASAVLERAQRLAPELGVPSVDSSVLLLALVREDFERGSGLLASLGVSSEQVDAVLRTAISHHWGATGITAAGVRMDRALAARAADEVHKLEALGHPVHIVPYSATFGAVKSVAIARARARPAGSLLVPRDLLTGILGAGERRTRELAASLLLTPESLERLTHAATPLDEAVDSELVSVKQASSQVDRLGPPV